MSREQRFDCEAFYRSLDAHRRQLVREQSRRVSWREIAWQLGISQSTFTRLGVHHHPPDADNLVRLLGWLGETDLRPYIITDGEAGP